MFVVLVPCLVPEANAHREEPVLTAFVLTFVALTHALQAIAARQTAVANLKILPVVIVAKQNIALIISAYPKLKIAGFLKENVSREKVVILMVPAKKVIAQM